MTGSIFFPCYVLFGMIKESIKRVFVVQTLCLGRAKYAFVEDILESRKYIMTKENKALEVRYWITNKKRKKAKRSDNSLLMPAPKCCLPLLWPQRLHVNLKKACPLRSLKYFQGVWLGSVMLRHGLVRTNMSTLWVEYVIPIWVVLLCGNLYVMQVC